MKTKVSALVVALVATAAGVATSQAIAADGASDPAKPASRGIILAPPDDDGSLEATPATDADTDRIIQRYRDASVSIAECPEALEFYAQPDVAAFYLKHFGYGPDINLNFIGGCPPTAVLKEALTNAMELKGVKEK